MSKIISQNKGKFLFSLLIVAVAIIVSIKVKNSQPAIEGNAEKTLVGVSVKPAADFKRLVSSISYPATVAGDQEVKISAVNGGIATAVNYDLGDFVSAGKILVRIDDQGNIGAGESGFRSSQIQQLELAVKQANEAYTSARDIFKKDSSDANETAKNIAKIQLESAQTALDSALNDHEIAAPISGTITSRAVSTGDAVAPGQLLATISKTNKLKIKFFVRKEDLKDIKLSETISVQNGGQKIEAKITNIAPSADELTRKFLVEAVPSQNNDLSLGMVLSVYFDVTQVPSDGGSLVLPLTAVNVNQNENSIFIIDNGTAKKIPVTVVKVTGETAEISGDITPDAQIIVDGNKLIADGEKVEVK